MEMEACGKCAVLHIVQGTVLTVFMGIAQLSCCTKEQQGPETCRDFHTLTQLGRESRAPVFSMSKVVKMRRDGEQRLEHRVCMCEAGVYSLESHGPPRAKPNQQERENRP